MGYERASESGKASLLPMHSLLISPVLPFLLESFNSSSNPSKISVSLQYLTCKLLSSAFGTVGSPPVMTNTQTENVNVAVSFEDEEWPTEEEIQASIKEHQERQTHQQGQLLQIGRAHV